MLQDNGRVKREWDSDSHTMYFELLLTSRRLFGLDKEAYVINVWQNKLPLNKGTYGLCNVLDFLKEWLQY